MNPRALILIIGILITASGASAQSAAQNFSYKAPSGMFSEGTTKWQMFQFIEFDAERMEQLRAGQAPTTGALSTSSSNGQSYPRPTEAPRGVRRPTSN